MSLLWRIQKHLVVAEDSDVEDNGSEDDLDFGIVITRVGSNEDDQANGQGMSSYMKS